MKKETNRERLSASVVNLYDAATLLKMVRMSGELTGNTDLLDTLGHIEQDIDEVMLAVNNLLAAHEFKRAPSPWWKALA